MSDLAAQALDESSSIGSVEIQPLSFHDAVALAALVAIGMDSDLVTPGARETGWAFIRGLYDALDGYPAIQACFQDLRPC